MVVTGGGKVKRVDDGAGGDGQSAAVPFEN